MASLRCYTRGIFGPVAQSVEQRIENPCVGGSIPPQATSIQGQPFSVALSFFGFPPRHAGCETDLLVVGCINRGVRFLPNPVISILSCLLISILSCPPISIHY